MTNAEPRYLVRTSLAQQFVHMWPIRTRRHLSASRLAKRYVDEKVQIVRSAHRLEFIYTFSDGSAAGTIGRGKSFDLEVLENKA